MKIAVAALTRKGSQLAYKVAEALQADVYLKPEFITDRQAVCVYPIEGAFKNLVSRVFAAYDAIIMIMATGIVVRSIADSLKSKASDPAIVVLDELGKHAISLLSGHIGGANGLAVKVAAITGGEPVITTATDVNGTISWDVCAAENHCHIENLGDLKYISSALVNGGTVAVVSDIRIRGELPNNLVLSPKCLLPGLEEAVVISNSTGPFDLDGYRKVLYLRPRNLVLGLGCRKGTSREHIESAVQDFMEQQKKSVYSLKKVATIDLKQDEAGLVAFCKAHELDLEIVDREAIRKREDSFSGSEFVKSITGISGVAEPCAVLASRKGRLIAGKTVYKGITLALAEEESEFHI